MLQRPEELVSRLTRTIFKKIFHFSRSDLLRHSELFSRVVEYYNFWCTEADYSLAVVRADPNNSLLLSETVHV